MDDDAAVRAVVEAILSSAGFDAQGAADGSEGIERAGMESRTLGLAGGQVARRPGLRCPGRAVIGSERGAMRPTRVPARSTDNR